MPTGYTADIAKGITFKEYALNCARAFSALILMRDEPSDAPIPERFEPSNWNANELQNVSERLVQLRLMSPAEFDTAAETAYTEAVEEQNRRIKECNELRAKYEAMLAQVVAWQAPTREHVEYKAFMENQIRESIDFDCRLYSENPTRMTGSQWLAKEIERAEWKIAYHTSENEKEIARTSSRNAWIKALRDALS